MDVFVRLHLQLDRTKLSEEDVANLKAYVDNLCNLDMFGLHLRNEDIRGERDAKSGRCLSPSISSEDDQDTIFRAKYNREALWKGTAREVAALASTISIGPLQEADCRKDAMLFDPVVERIAEASNPRHMVRTFEDRFIGLYCVLPDLI
ncbi:hypothetical protein BJX99DRAFT_258711 [Aspergillus californicus]